MATSQDSRARCIQELSRLESCVSQLTAFVGLDGFVDEIIHVVDKREGAHSFERIPTITSFAERIADAAGKSTNIELMPQQVKLGGNGPIMTSALAAFGVRVSYVGALGFPNLHPVFSPLADKGEVFSIAEAAHTDALEFDDGKLMFGKMTPLNDVTWPNIEERMGREKFESKITSSDLISFVNWTMIPHMSDIWESILGASVLPNRSSNQTAFFDLCDPEKRKYDDIIHAMKLLGRFREHLRVILGLNEKEALELGDVYGITAGSDSPDGCCSLAKALFEKLDVDMLVVHPVTYALVVTEEATTWVRGPFIEKPVITTGAGDHFNAGFCLAQLLGMSPESCLYLGVSSSGHYVKTGRSPNVNDLRQILTDWLKS
ncbi:MAG: hypothetical protein M2R45_05066 [Verrucomicrobia subdivision 3 bacterium]|nr:hypothetical protein [Limisphaerales bacterium]MCS1417731.1 hypothetical protein [Limisphaerales bacterium]